MPDFLDPLTWVLLVKEWGLRRHGYRCCRAGANARGFRYFFREPAKKTATEAPALVLVNGLALFPEWWGPLLKLLPEDRPILVPELLGFSRSPGKGIDPEAFSLDLYREQLGFMKEASGTDKVVLAGVSLGGWICLDYAQALPEQVSGLILIGPAGVSPDMTRESLLSLKSVFDYKTADDFNRLMNGFVFSRPKPIPGWVGALAVRRSKTNGHKHLLHNLRFEDWVGERCAAIRTPTALIWGREDKVFAFRDGEKIESLMPRARLFGLDGVSHSYLFEHAEATCRAFFDALEYIENPE